ncbi:rhodanese-like domain-containing protein [Amycolatopsis taiwanensis]|uniref:Sulfurtransferase n=1 Tax=Amycolatopsis taiwanensis TaxID=342230 RepID=A0A9W6VL62_9PSEU|nr:rhodanese-like domain-containing protein [Amycolatopsis taiwanensis]GLY71137.1 sulfurtransferase [Amycolatopsis taiwanensis]
MNVEAFLADARAEIDRVAPRAAYELLQAGALLVDIRPHANRLAEGEVPGSLVIERLVLEWRLDPQGAHRVPQVQPDTRVVVMCNEGYASSLAARDLKRIGLRHATDLVGGFRGWVGAGLPSRPGGSPAIT